MYSIRPSPGKGLGVFANVLIKAGTRIMADEPLVSIVESSKNEEVERRISAALELLKEGELEKFGQLHWPRHFGWQRQASQYVGNAFELGPGVSGVFPTASRINNSCGANAIFSWNSSLHRLTVHAMVDIPQGNEVTVGYMEHSYFSLASRQRRLTMAYNFTCDCSACHREVERNQGAERLPSKDVRLRMESLAEPLEYYRLGRRSDPDKELELVIEFLVLAKQAGLEGQFLTGMYGRASRLYDAKGSLEQAIEYAQVEYLRAANFLGRDSPLTEEAARAAKDLKSKIALRDQAK